MTFIPHIMALSGSLRAGSACTAILNTLADRTAGKARIDVTTLADVPLYNADNEGANQPDAVRALKEAVGAVDGLILCSPEYNYGMSGVLKNAIDWVSRPGYASPLKGKPVLIMTASPAATGGVRAQQQMRDALAATLSRVVSRPEIVIPQAYDKIVEGRLCDEATLAFCLAGVDDLMGEVALLRAS